MQLADRVSVNLEGATEERLAALAPKKHFMSELLQMLQWADQIRRDNPRQRLASTVTQFVVGAVGDTDLELLALSDKLYGQLQLARVYYSGFSPVETRRLKTSRHSQLSANTGCIRQVFCSAITAGTSKTYHSWSPATSAPMWIPNVRLPTPHSGTPLSTFRLLSVLNFCACRISGQAELTKSSKPEGCIG